LASDVVMIYLPDVVAVVIIKCGIHYIFFTCVLVVVTELKSTAHDIFVIHFLLWFR